jgi:hypothetical protein
MVSWLVNDRCWPSQKGKVEGHPDPTSHPVGPVCQMGPGRRVSGLTCQWDPTVSPYTPLVGLERLCRMEKIETMRWLRNLAQVRTWQRCGEDGLIPGTADGLDSARVVHDEGMSRPRRKVWSGLEGYIENMHLVLRLRLGGKRVSAAAHHATPKQER